MICILLIVKKLCIHSKSHWFMICQSAFKPQWSSVLDGWIWHNRDRNKSWISYLCSVVVNQAKNFARLRISFFPVMIRLRFILLSGNLFNNYRTHYVGWRFSRWHSRLTCTNLVIRFFEKLVGILASWGRTESRKRVFCGRIGTGAKFLNVLKAELPKLNLILYIGPFGRSKMSNEICQTEQVESTDWDAFDISN